MTHERTLDYLSRDIVHRSITAMNALAERYQGRCPLSDEIPEHAFGERPATCHLCRWQNDVRELCDRIPF